jgi:uncharacterized delta-60 repeat protein
MNKIVFKIVFFILFISTSLIAQQGNLDVAFNTFDDGKTGEGFDGNVRVVIENTDKTSYIAGNFLNFNGATATRIIKLDSDGNVDSATGFVSGIGFNNSVTSGFKTLTNKLLYGGSFTSYDVYAVSRLGRLNLDGTIDATFNIGNVGPNNTVQALAQFADGSIIVAGDAITVYNGIAVNNVFKIDSEGVLNTIFSSNITAETTGAISKIIIQPDGKILICGSFTSFNGTTTRGLTRLNADGTVDAAFNINLGLGADLNIFGMDLQPDGKIILGGSFTSFNGLAVGRIIRLNSTGTIDATFNNAKTGFVNGIVQVIKYNAIDGIYVAGSFTGDYNGEVAKLNRLILLQPNGAINTGFDNVTGLPSSTFYTIEKAIDGQIFLGGSFTTYDATPRGRLLKVNNKGVLDIDFMSSGGVGASGNVLKVISLSSKKVMIFGSFTNFNGNAVGRIARLNEDGSLDTTFNFGGTGFTSNVRAAVELSDGSFIVGGDFAKYNTSLGTTTRNKILKIDANGVLDTSFDPNMNGNVYSIAIDASGKILVGGNFTTVGGVSRNRLVRLNSDGTLDVAFAADVDANVDVILPETTSSKIIIGGRFLNFNGVPVTYLVRINSDGSLDASFNNSNGPNNFVYSLARQSLGELLVGGSFTTFGGFSKRRFVRLTDAGAIDGAFNSGIAFSNGDVRTMIVQPDDRIIIGGSFSGTSVGADNLSYPVRRIVRINSDGSYNATFKSILNSTCYASAFDSEGRIMIGGSFNSVNGISKYRIARVLACINNNTYTSAGWTRIGTPDKKYEVSIDSDLTLATDARFCNCSTAATKKLTVNEGVVLTLELDVYGDATTRSGSIEFKNNASLLQKDSNSINTGNIIYKRSSTTLNDYDYVYWSSPVSVPLVAPLPGSDKSWSFVGGNWSGVNMNPGVGFIVRYKSLAVQKAVFNGLPNNGDFLVSSEGVSKSNLIGNPYPSAISADDFIEENEGIIGSALYFWTHTTARSKNTAGTKFEYVSDDYATYNRTGGAGVSTAAAISTDNDDDGIGDGVSPSGHIAAGQSFFVTSNSSGDFKFTNLMRTGSNSQFFKPKAKKKTKAVEKNRLWLNLTNDRGAFKQLLVGYVTGATNDFDTLYDGIALNANAYIDFYSIENSEKYTIQGRALPFDIADEVPLGYKSAIEGTFQIAIDNVDGFFTNQTVYLEDKTFNTIHDLTKGSYSFTTVKGEFRDRFVLRYDSEKLSTDDVAIKKKEVVVLVKKHQIKINSFGQILSTVQLFDLKGSLLYSKTNIDKDEVFVNDLISSNQVLIVLTELENGQKLSNKIIYRN